MSKRILCIIPARGGSKRFPRKNIALLCGKPLIGYAIEEAKESGVFDKIVVSTEDKEILEIAKKFGADVVGRSEYLASDKARVPEVCLDVINKLEKEGEYFDILCILLPTSPLRKSEHIRGALKKFEESGADYLMSTTDYRYSPFRALAEKENGFYKLYFGGEFVKRDQDLPQVEVHNGCILITKIKRFKEDKDYYKDNLTTYKMNAMSSIDVNEEIDLKLAEFFMRELDKKIKLRDINKSDCKFLYGWRNHPIARAASIITEEIPYEDHVKWFEGSMKNPKRKIYIAIDDEGNRIGQIRFDEEDSDAIVSVTVDPEKYGKGIGTKIIEEGTKKYLCEHPTKKIKAEVKKDNPASVRAFEKAGYKLAKKGQDDLLEYEFER